MSNKPQAQFSLLKQLKKLYIIANQNGLYDAADVIAKIIKKPQGGK